MIEEHRKVTGVFTSRDSRQKGLAKRLMLHLLADCRDFNGHFKNALFTGEIDLPAQKLYESIGYKRVGNFALLLG